MPLLPRTIEPIRARVSLGPGIGMHTLGYILKDSLVAAASLALLCGNVTVASRAAPRRGGCASIASPRPCLPSAAERASAASLPFVCGCSSLPFLSSEQRWRDAEGEGRSAAAVVGEGGEVAGSEEDRRRERERSFLFACRVSSTSKLDPQLGGAIVRGFRPRRGGAPLGTSWATRHRLAHHRRRSRARPQLLLSLSCFDPPPQAPPRPVHPILSWWPKEEVGRRGSQRRRGRHGRGEEKGTKREATERQRSTRSRPISIQSQRARSAASSVAAWAARCCHRLDRLASCHHSAPMPCFLRPRFPLPVGKEKEERGDEK
uniref:Uncharacterized protein n=1 Tax=Oryza sativa subsp. japonica TaxID=39947 RepID=Q6ZGH2_ORYSJ|nr:hypothetical protein [Oryza sativa Japonica Group]